MKKVSDYKGEGRVSALFAVSSSLGDCKVEMVPHEIIRLYAWHGLCIYPARMEVTMARLIRDLIAAVACGSLLALLLGCATVPQPIPEPEVPCVCTTDSDCADRCGGEY